ncbi:EPIDERMAL PATTERNING FACTOR-like protein 9 [Trifolium pratense]|uniref:EPIDERMAL PATTERNING FACTOR-like protein 9 n=1 Tax=Trifolium pratense TaxID=57577 RepID=UPI001E6970C5|nr:EPIDERMAL PATTERNING FACTOR-like protein 9 [Trifolium pratense]
MFHCLSADFASLSLMVTNSPQHHIISFFLHILSFQKLIIFILNIFSSLQSYNTKNRRMGYTKLPKVFMLLLTLILAAKVIQGIETKGWISQSSQLQRESNLKGSNEAWKVRNYRRLMIGSTAPTCTYNECRGCKYRCRAEQVPVEGNDPINSPYHYRCVCHR